MGSFAPNAAHIPNGGCRNSLGWVGALAWATYATICFIAVTFGNARVSDSIFAELRVRCALSDSSGKAQEHLACDHVPQGLISTEPYGEKFRRFELTKCASVGYALLASMIFGCMFALLRLEQLPKWRSAWAIGCLAVFGSSSFWAFKLMSIRISENSVFAVTAIVHASTIAVVYSTQKYCFFYKTPQSTKEQLKLNKLLLQAGFFVFGAFCISLMLGLSQGMGEHYKEAVEVYARLQPLVDLRIAMHATLISVGILAGVVVRLLDYTQQLIERS